MEDIWVEYVSVHWTNDPTWVDKAGAYACEI